VVRRLMIGAAFVLLACGPEATAPEPVDQVTPALVSADPHEGHNHPETKPTKAKPAGTDPLKQTETLEVGDVHIVFTNNLDGEIDPCG